MNRNLVRKTRQPRGTGTPRVLVRLTAEQYPLLHEYCLTQDDINSQERYQRRKTGNAYIPKNPMTPVCEHPEHGFCSHDQPTPEQIEEINARLAQRTSGGIPITDELIEKLSKEAEEGYDLERVRKGHVKRVAKIPSSGIKPARFTTKKKRKYTKRAGVVYGRPKK